MNLSQTLGIARSLAMYYGIPLRARRVCASQLPPDRFAYRERRMKVALIQMNSGSDKAANIAAARALIDQAVAEEKPDWVCLPEVFDFMGGSFKDKQAAAETIPGGPAYAMLQEQAKKHGIFIHAGSILERIEGEARVGNTTVVFDRQGRELARYRKIHMFDITAPDGAKYHESAAMKPGDAAPSR